MKFKYPGMPPPEVLKFHFQCLLIDLHVDSLLIRRITRINLCRQHGFWMPRGYFAFHADVPRLRLGNVGGVFLGLVPKPFGRNGAHIDKMIDMAYIIGQISKHNRKQLHKIRELYNRVKHNPNANPTPKKIRNLYQEFKSILKVLSLTPFSVFPS